MYSTARSVDPSTACSGGRYAIRMYRPSDGPAPALVTYERRPFASLSGVPSPSVIGSRPSGYRLTPLAEVWSSTVSVQRIAAGSSSRWRRCASLPTKSSSFTFGRCMPASTTVYSLSSSAAKAR